MKCPGQDMQYWKEGAIFEVPCPQCSAIVEFYKDDTSRICPGCGKRFVNPQKDFGCASYCQYAEQCLGTLPDDFVGGQEALLKDKIAVEVKRLYKTDFKAIGHTTRVARYAEQIGKVEGGNLAIILSAALLHDIGKVTDQTNPPSSPADIRRASAETAQLLLTRLKAKEAVLQAVLAIIAETEEAKATIEFQVVADAVLIATLEQSIKEGETDAARTEARIATIITPAGREIAQRLCVTSLFPL